MDRLHRVPCWLNNRLLGFRVGALLATTGICTGISGKQTLPFGNRLGWDPLAAVDLHLKVCAALNSVGDSFDSHLVHLGHVLK